MENLSLILCFFGSETMDNPAYFPVMQVARYTKHIASICAADTLLFTSSK